MKIDIRSHIAITCASSRRRVSAGFIRPATSANGVVAGLPSRMPMSIPCGAEPSAAHLNDAAHVPPAHGSKLSKRQPLAAIAQADYLKSACERTADYGANRRGHARRITTAGQHC